MDDEPSVAPDSASRRSGVARDVLLTFGGRLALTAVTIAGDVIIARSLGPDGKGAFALVLNLSSLGAVLLALGMERSLAVFAGRSLEVARRAFANSALWTLVAGGFGFLAILGLYAIQAQGEPSTGQLAGLLPDLAPNELLLGALSLPAELAFGIGLVGLLGRQQVVAYNVMRFARRGTLVVFLIPVFFISSVSLQVVLLLNLVALAAAVAGIVFSMARVGMVGTSVSLPLLWQQLSFGGRAVVGTVAERLHFRANTFVINAFVGIAATGVFSVALALSETLWYLPAAFGTVLFSRAIAGGTEGAGIASAMTRTMLALMVVVAVPLWLLAPFAVELVYGAPFAAAGQALQILLPGVLAYSVVMVLSNPIIAWGAPGKMTAVLVTGLVVNIIANLALVPELGMNGAALASTISYTTTGVLTVALYRALSGQSVRQTLVVRRSDATRAWVEMRSRLGGLAPRST